MIEIKGLKYLNNTCAKCGKPFKPNEIGMANNNEQARAGQIFHLNCAFPRESVKVEDKVVKKKTIKKTDKNSS